MKALISPDESGRVVQIENKTFPVAEPLFWIDCPVGVTPEFRFADGEFIPPDQPEITPEQNATAAVAALSATDWVNQPDVTDPANVPRLANKSAFDAYRIAIRRIMINPPAGGVEWPQKPVAEWVTE